MIALPAVEVPKKIVRRPPPAPTIEAPLFVTIAFAAVTTNERGKIIRTIAAVRPKVKIRTRLGDGEFGSEVL